MAALGYYPTQVPELVVDITVDEYKDNTVRVRGIGVNPETNVIYKDLGTAISKRVSRKRQTYQINYVRKGLESRYAARYGSVLADANLMQRAFDILRYRVEEDHYRLKPQWDKDSTNLAAIGHFDRNGLALLKPFADPNQRLFLECDRREIEDSLVNKVMRRNGGRQDAARVDAQNHLADWELILKRMREIDPRLPELNLVPAVRAKRVPPKEQVKYLPRPLLMKLYSKLKTLVAVAPKMVFFAILVIFGLRPAEAAACKPCNIRWHSTYCTLLVTHQEIKGMLCDKLKNEYSRRIIIIPYWGKVLLERCCERIADNYPHDNHAMHCSKECSLWVKQLLIEIGVEEEYINEVGMLIPNADMDDDAVLTPISTAETLEIRSYKIACYVLRRVFATIMRSVMGLSQFETDRILGHIPLNADGKRVSAIRANDLNSESEQAKIAKKMERFIFDEKLSLNPSCTPYSIREEEILDLIEYSEYVIHNDTDVPMVFDLNLHAAESGERVEIEMPLNARETLTRHSNQKTWEDKARAVIGDTSRDTAYKGVEKTDGKS